MSGLDESMKGKLTQLLDNQINSLLARIEEEEGDEAEHL
jgi:hypothetical protein